MLSYYQHEPDHRDAEGPEAPPRAALCCIIMISTPRVGGPGRTRADRGTRPEEHRKKKRLEVSGRVGVLGHGERGKRGEHGPAMEDVESPAGAADSGPHGAGDESPLVGGGGADSNGGDGEGEGGEGPEADDGGLGLDGGLEETGLDGEPDAPRERPRPPAEFRVERRDDLARRKVGGRKEDARQRPQDRLRQQEPSLSASGQQCQPENTCDNRDAGAREENPFGRGD
mmetsp:Transcript_11446/g.36343  ORF Transcript_11446/g.36343 Transcript_11446/m.36343 type:complete len:228 (+) Transcript_11446:13-696(+)